MNMPRKQVPMFVLGITFFLLVLDGAQGSRFWSYEPARRWYRDFAFPEKVQLSNRNFDDDTAFFGSSDSQGSSNSFTEGRVEGRLAPEPASAAGNEVKPENKFVFPDFDPQPLKSVPICEGSTFCEDVPHYPTDVVNKAVMNDKSLRNYANIDVIETIAQRIGEPKTETTCVSKERIVYPRSAQAMDENWYFVVNHPQVRQGVRIEVCEVESEPCKAFGGLRAGAVATCAQKYIYRKLMAVKNETVDSQYFRFPTSCCCHVEFTGNPIARIFGFEDFEPSARMIRKT